jgi:hypothetical protein
MVHSEKEKCVLIYTYVALLGLKGCFVRRVAMSISLISISTSLTNLDFIPIQQFAAPNGTTWHAFAAADADSWWYEEPIVWEIFVAEMPRRNAPALFFVQGTLLPMGLFVRTEHDWAVVLMQLLPEMEEWTDMDVVD